MARLQISPEIFLQASEADDSIKPRGGEPVVRID